MLSSVQEKSQLKGILGYYLIGAILVLTTPNLLAFGYNVTESVNHNYEIVEVPPTCTTAGCIKYVCRVHENCSKNKEETKQALGHNWGGWYVEIPAECEKTGREKRVCSRRCEETRTIEALEHQWSDYETTKLATCSEKGTSQKECSLCSKVETKEIAKLAHTYGSWTTTIQPTCSTQGAKERKCTVCSYINKTTISTTSHSYGDRTIVGTTNTCYKKQCKNCGYINEFSHDTETSTSYLSGKKHVTRVICKVCSRKFSEEVGDCGGYTSYLKVVEGELKIVYQCAGCGYCHTSK